MSGMRCIQRDVRIMVIITDFHSVDACSIHARLTPPLFANQGRQIGALDKIHLLFFAEMWVRQERERETS